MTEKLFGQHEDDVVGDDYFVLAEPVMKALAHAKESCGLTFEFMQAFLDNLGVSLMDVEQAIAHAYREWDL